MMNRRVWIAAVPLSLAGLVVSRRGMAGSKPAVEVFKNASCGCCSGWIAHLRNRGFTVTAQDVAELEPIKRKAGVPDALASCHTAFIAGYVVEGHVPADAVEKLLAERPDVKGIAVPGMPLWSPGMEAPGSPREPFHVMTVPKVGAPTVFVAYPQGYRPA